MSPLFFMHVHKTGGTSLAGYLDRHFSNEKAYMQMNLGTEHLYNLVSQGGDRIFANYDLVEAHLSLRYSLTMRNSAKTCTLLRKPRDRILSYYAHYRRSLEKSQLSLAAKSMDLTKFLEAAQELENHDVYNATACMLLDKADVSSGISQDDLFDALESVDFVGTLPRLHELCLVLANEYGWLPPMAAPRARVASNYATELSVEMERKLAERCWADNLLYEFAEDRIRQHVSELRRGLEKLSFRSSYNLVYRRYEKRIPICTTKVEISFEQAISGDGWHHRQSDGKDSFYRWTGPSTSAFIDLPVKANGALQVIVSIINPGPPDTLKNLTFNVCGQLLNHAFEEDNGNYYASFVIPKILGKKGRGVRLHINTPVQHDVLLIDPVSSVKCGIAVSRIICEPAVD